MQGDSIGGKQHVERGVCEMNAVYSQKIVMIIVIAKQCMKAYITGCWERYVYGPVVGVMDETISLVAGKSVAVSREKLKEAVENLYYEANLLEQDCKPGERRAFHLIAEAMRETAAFMEQNFVINRRREIVQ